MRISDLARSLNEPMVDRLRRCADDATPGWDARTTIYPPEACELVALIDTARNEPSGGQTGTHEITIFPCPDEPSLLDWLCSCGVESDSYYGEFGEAAGEAADHVPADQRLIITRPKVAEVNGDDAPNDVVTHYVHLGERTVCGEQKTQVPHTHDVNNVTCQHCRKWLLLKGLITAPHSPKGVDRD